MPKTVRMAVLYAVGLALVAWLSPFVGAPSDQVLGYVAQAALLGAAAGAIMGSVLKEYDRTATVLGAGLIFLVLANGVGQGGLAVAAANGVCWLLGLLVLGAIAGGLEKRTKTGR